MYTYPARPKMGGRIWTSSDVLLNNIYRPKIDGSRVLVDTWELQAFNRHGDHYSKATDLPWDSLERMALMLSALEFENDIVVPSDQGVRWLDIEFFDKHKEFKGDCALLDAPSRQIGFAGLVKLLAYSHIPIDSKIINLSWASWAGLAHEHKALFAENIPNEGGEVLPEILPRIRWLPYWEVQDEGDQGVVFSLWELLKEEAVRIMKIHGESTPFYEGLVGVETNSPYPRQLRSGSEVYSKWTKHRFSQ